MRWGGWIGVVCLVLVAAPSSDDAAASAPAASIASASDGAPTHLTAAPCTHDYDDDDDSRPLDDDDDPDDDVLPSGPLAVALPMEHYVRYRPLHVTLHAPPDSDELMRPPQPRVD